MPTTDLAGGCFRSSGNYPARVAASLRPRRFVDVSCGAADTGDITGRQEVARARGTDEGLLVTLALGCRTDAGKCPSPPELRGVLQRTETRIARTLRAIQRRAPEARVVLVGYPRIVSERRGCPTFPVPRALVDMYTASRGHEVCSAAPWVNGARTDESAALAFHPFASGQEAVAERVLSLVDRA